jgi:hypothetical protein
MHPSLVPTAPRECYGGIEVLSDVCMDIFEHVANCIRIENFGHKR